VEDNKQYGHPIMVKTDKNVEKVRTLVKTHNLSMRMVAEELNMDKETDKLK
jgi:hypothetical protein